ncbi:MAG: transcription termination/antitermination protein NusA [Phycisphaerales bacterium]|nr:MAG: transcription termination/antitermination protein NusA [Phycisphaerales bacterium]
MINQQEVIRIVDSICRDKAIDKDMVYADLEAAMVSAARKAYGQSEDVTVSIDRMTGEIRAVMDGEPITMKDLGRIAAQTFKQVMIQRIREAERGSIFDEYSDKVGTIVTGTVARFESGALVISLGRAEGFLPRSEQIPGESHHPGDRVRAMVLDVEEKPNQVRIVLTRSHPDYIRRLFEVEVPEVGERIIEIRALAREAGYRTKVAVSSIDTKVDAVGACVGVRGSRIRNIVDELGGEKIDIVRWNESSQILIANALKPAEVQEIALCFELNRATVVVAEDQLSLAIGKRGQNVRLAARLTGWDIDILTPAEYNKGLDEMEKALRSVDGVEDVMLDKLMAMGVISVGDIEEIGPAPLVKELDVSEELAERIAAVAAREAKRLAAEAQAAKEAEAAAQAAAEEQAAQADAAGEEAQIAAGDVPQDQDPEAATEEIESGGAEGPEASTAAPDVAPPADDEGVMETTVGQSLRRGRTSPADQEEEEE